MKTIKIIINDTETKTLRVNDKDLYIFLKIKRNSAELLSKGLSKEQIEEFFLKALRDYFEKEISLSILSVVDCQLFYELKSPGEIQSCGDELLADALEAATDIYFYKKFPITTHNKKMYDSYLKKTKDYYEKRKAILKKVPQKVVLR